MDIELVKVKVGDIELGKPLPFSIYTQEQLLLLKKTTVVSSLKQLNILLERGVYRNLTEQEIQALKIPKENLAKLESNPFACIRYCVEKLHPLTLAINSRQAENAHFEIQNLAGLLKNVVTLDPNAALGAIHLMHSISLASYAVSHVIYTSIVSGLLARRRNLPDSEIEIIICAALTMNVNIMQLQDLLYEQSSPLTDDQRQQIYGHPESSASLLKDAGVHSESWLQIVTQHHEKNDGSGYPRNLSNDDIFEGAKIVALSDIYTSLITGRKHRPPILAHEAIKTLFAKRGGEIDEQLANQFIREIGVYPPGTLIQLENGEIALITKRSVTKSNKTSGPYALSLVSPRGAKYQQSPTRDCSIDLFKIRKALDASHNSYIDADIEKFWGY